MTIIAIPAPVYFNYDVLVNEIQSFAQKNDPKFISQIPVFIANAENRLALMIKNLGQQKSVTQSPTSQTIALPNRWHVTTSISVKNTITNELQYLFERTLEFVKFFQTEVTTLYPALLPQFYANYDFDNLIITPWDPTLATNWMVELTYYERPLPLSENNQTNWWTAYAPQALLYACLREAAMYSRMAERTQEFEQLLQAEIMSINKEDSRRITDRSYNVVGASS